MSNQEKASEVAKRKILNDIEHDAEMKIWFEAKVVRTPIEHSDPYRHNEAFYTEKLEKDIELAKMMGITKQEINDAKDRGFDKAYDAIEESDNQGWE